MCKERTFAFQSETRFPSFWVEEAHVGQLGLAFLPLWGVASRQELLWVFPVGRILFQEIGQLCNPERWKQVLGRL